MAERLSMSLRSYQSLERGDTKLDLERLLRIAGILETSLYDLLRHEELMIHQEVKDNAYDNKNGLFYNYCIGEDMLNRLLSAKATEIESLIEENRYLKESIDKLLEAIGKKP
jgi:transcriptional regulator with XRE-family HTH domain